MKEAQVKQLFSYPIKGLTPHPIQGVTLEEDCGIRGDRAFALMFVDGSDTPPATLVPWMSKAHFAVQNDWPKLAKLECFYNAETDCLTIRHQGVTLLEAATETQPERDRISAFFTGFLADAEPTPEARHPQYSPLQLVGVRSGETRYPDRAPVHISLMSQATLDALTEACGTLIDVRRFRPNILLEGIAPWEEFNGVGEEFYLGESKIVITARIGRCANIEVDPDNGDRNLRLLSVLKNRYGHLQAGVLAKIITPGSVKIGDRLTSVQ
ncbi:MOSC domain-containing protein [Laspinema olomoucense]|uniref:MOSC domain-containing protein n=1 Tax=Laspinema olomoucense D3b TaxID=2953688 RepID=A0ABT2NG21_9CYAN|nr:MULTISPECIES: MOSC N-terminal beta barrel domain-containing protein [unclassified Laspinema]MCT7974987.1 MOSC domain-containing protein [Laspinema sp. D3d]MCT7980211.1 MOSC domain-containing protein [Laspinema sp. D3b]MCT7988356.1 MOSC domain-containing protein [Laspinema sp. D3a]MCT7996656.1 MOSC domain-containing protein [Laspinema sp. D3c]